MDTPFPTTPTPPKKSSGSGAIISFAIFILAALGVIVFLYNQNQNLKKKLVEYQITPVTVSTSSPIPETVNQEEPTISSPSARSKVKSPLTVIGILPAGWMFEGIFPVKLLDSGGDVIAQTSAKEVTPGSWQSGNPVEFTATLTFKTATGSGTIVLENDNPSGDIENDKEFEIPIVF